MANYREWALRIGRVVGVLVLVVAAGGSAAWLAAGTTRNPNAAASLEKKDPDAARKIRRTGPDEVIVPSEVQTALGLKTAPAAIPTRKRKLPAFQGTLNFENSRFARVQTMFPGRVEELATIPEPLLSALPGSPPATAPRPLTDGDVVKKDTVLAVVWSKDLGEKKSEYVDALSKLKTDEVTLANLQDLYEKFSTTERAVREQDRTVQGDRVAVERAEATLRAWKITAEELAALQAEATRLSRPEVHFFSFPLQKRTDPAKWARFEIKAPLSGVILEKNVTFVGQMVDPSMDLYRIADLSVLAVWVHLYEEDLPLLRGIKTPAPWVVSVPSWPGVTFSGKMESIGASIDSTQHTALLKGTVDNANGQLRSGLGVMVALELPPATGEIELPAEAVIEDGRESSVFVRPDLNDSKFVRRPVSVVRRSRDVIFIAANPDGVKPGDHVVTAGSLLLGDAVNDLPQPKR